MTYSICYISGPEDHPFRGLVVNALPAPHSWQEVEQHDTAPEGQVAYAEAEVVMSAEDVALVGLRCWVYTTHLLRAPAAWVVPSMQSQPLEEEE